MTASTSVRSTVYTCPRQAGRDRLRRDKSLENVLRTAQKQRLHRSKVVRGTGIESVKACQTARTLSPNLLSANLCGRLDTGRSGRRTSAAKRRERRRKFRSSVKGQCHEDVTSHSKLAGQTPPDGFGLPWTFMA